MILTGACTGAASDVSTGPRIVSEVTLGPATNAAPTRVLTATPVPITPEVLPLLEMVTVDADFVLVTPTLPPSKTPTLTPTLTLTPTISPTPSLTATASMTTFLLPTSVIIPVTQVVAAPASSVCDSTWFFIEPRPASCPVYPPTASQAVYQSFENGYMVWLGNQNAIYVLYNDPIMPRWQVFRDYFAEGMAEFSPDYVAAPRPGVWQPRRGFGLLWRDNAAVRDRIGWGTIEFEQPYSAQVQTANDGAVFISQPTTGVFTLMPGGSNWSQFSTSFPGLSPAINPATNPGLVPLPTVRPPGL